MAKPSEMQQPCGYGINKLRDFRRRPSAHDLSIDGCGPVWHEFAAHNIYGIFTGESSSEFLPLYQVSNARSGGRGGRWKGGCKSFREG